jgi:dsDNA-specific endonuclease/ATPase MutS2
VPPVSRRVLLTATPLALATLAACGTNTTDQANDAESPTTDEDQGPDLADELTLIAAYTGAIESFPQLRGTLNAIADQHRAHARQLGAGEEELAAIAATLPGSEKIKPAITELIELERAAAKMRASSAQRSTDTDNTRTLTFIAASEASHVPELIDVRSSTNANAGSTS